MTRHYPDRPIVGVGPVLEVFDRIIRDADGRVEYHYVLVDYLCWPIGGALQAGSDVDAAVIERAVHLARINLEPNLNTDRAPGT